MSVVLTVTLEALAITFLAPVVMAGVMVGFTVVGAGFAAIEALKSRFPGSEIAEDMVKSIIN